MKNAKKQGNGNRLSSLPAIPAIDAKEAASVNVNEKILKRINDIYSTDKDSLVSIAELVGEQLIVPRKKITVMLIGNHSAGKSTFVNWYIDQQIQKTGVAIETKKFTVITSGKKADDLKGSGTMQMFKHLVPFTKFEGVVLDRDVETRVCDSTARKFRLVDFIDTPGLVDGNIEYPFAVEDIITWFSDHCDLIMVMFDPIGQALCERTMKVVQQINERHPEKLKFYLSKADDVSNESDRQKVLIQITQNLSFRIKNKNFDLPTIYIPYDSSPEFLKISRNEKKVEVPNAMDELCNDISKTIQANVQSNLNTLEVDSQKLINKIKFLIEDNERKVEQNRLARNRSWGFFLASTIFPILGLLYVALRFLPVSTFIPDPRVGAFQQSAQATLDGLSMEINTAIAGILTVLFFVFTLLSKNASKKRQDTLTKVQIAALKDKQKHLEQVIKQKSVMFDEYIKELGVLDD